MTYGQLKFRLAKAFPGVDADLIEGWITDCYQEVLGALPWSRLDLQSVLITTAPYATGKASVTNGLNTISLTGGTWTSGMTGRAFRVSGDQEEYEFTFATSTSGTIDRPYQGTTNAAAGYSIYQSVYPMPAACRFLDEEAFASFELGPLTRLAAEEGQAMLASGAGEPPYPSGGTLCVGVPRVWWPYMDDASTPPNMQVRFSPVPDKVYAIPFTYCAEAQNPTGTNSTMLPWVQPAALIEGSTAKIKRHLKDYAGAEEARKAYADALHVMVSQEAYRRGPTQVQLSSYYTSHRLRRGR